MMTIASRSAMKYGQPSTSRKDKDNPLDQPPPAQSKVFIVTPGRAGSTLFCSILASAGADFGMPSTGDWDVRAGGYEHDACNTASAHSKRALELKTQSRLSRVRMYLRKYHRTMAKRSIGKVLTQADYIKHSDADLVRWSRGLGYQPSVILLYRSFNLYCVSNYLRAGGTYERLLSHYADTIETGLLSIATFGGCVVSFDDVIDPAQVAWAQRVGQVTGLDTQQLLASRDEVVKPTNQAPNLLAIDNPRIAAIEQAIAAIADQVCPPSAQSKRGI